MTLRLVSSHDLRPALHNETCLRVFEEILGWQMKMAQRHEQVRVSLAVMQPSGESTSGEFFSLVQRNIRDADLTAYGHSDEVWVLLPYSDINASLARFCMLFAQSGCVDALQCSGVTLGHEQPEGSSAQQLMADLRKALR